MKIKKKISSHYYYLQWLWNTRKMRSNFPTLKILSLENTIQKIINEKISISRFGDGEFRLCLPNYYLEFQEGGEEIRNKLRETLQSNCENHLVCLPEPLSNTKPLNIKSRYWWKKFINNYGEKITPYLDTKKVYGDTNMTRFYLGYADKSEKAISKRVNLLKQIWQDKEVLIVEGKYSRLGIGNDLFNNAKSIHRIICPPKNAFRNYTEIFETTKKLGENKLILLALGPTATIMSHDLAKSGFWSIDVGHIDIEYMWYLMKANDKLPIKGRHVNEASHQESLELPEEYKQSYQESILMTIKQS